MLANYAKGVGGDVKMQLKGNSDISFQLVHMSRTGAAGQFSSGSTLLKIGLQKKSRLFIKAQDSL